MSKRKQRSEVAPEPGEGTDAPPARTFTASRYFRTRSKEQIVVAFLHVERLERARERKLSASEWDSALAAFAAAPR